MTEAVKNKIADRKTDPTIKIKIDEKEPEEVKRMTKAEGEKLIEAYKKQCERYPVRMEKFKRKEKAGEFKKFLDSLAD